MKVRKITVMVLATLILAIKLADLAVLKHWGVAINFPNGIYNPFVEFAVNFIVIFAALSIPVLIYIIVNWAKALKGG